MTAVDETAQAYLNAVQAACDSGPLSMVFPAYHLALQAAGQQTVSRDNAVQLLAHHAITRPLHTALFVRPYPFVAQTGITRIMAPILRMIDTVIDVDLSPLQPLYRRAVDRAAAVTSHADRQPVICELYETFYRTALPRAADMLGIVYTPVEVVDFIIRSTEQGLQDHHGRSLAAEDVQIVDPFVGTGIFFVRLLQSSQLIPDAVLPRVYRDQMHGHEIVPLSWHIARTNIEIAYAERAHRYLPCHGLVLTDTFAADLPCCLPAEQDGARP
ncbi:N-6 DNA methylase [Streptomyces hirsutus]|uniref:N-6 DNA methylase n=1 Tax=Streptomyces hirsutus TaxID=35620 RepID=UPI0036660452